jgi:intracellular sulfur oxidation DsrE/DsrF family protein
MKTREAISKIPSPLRVQRSNLQFRAQNAVCFGRSSLAKTDSVFLKCLLIFFLFPLFALAQTEPMHRVVIQFSDSDSLSQASVTGQVKNIRAVWPNAAIEVVCHGPGLDLLVTKKSKAATAVQEWSKKGVVFAACQNTMQRRNVKPEDLLPAAASVPSAMVELIVKQEEGWAYVKGGH